MSETRKDGPAFTISVGLAFTGGYADAPSYLLAHTFTGHITENCVLAGVGAASAQRKRTDADIPERLDYLWFPG